MSPTLGILITYHNERELLTECLRSIANQSFCPNEILIYDDASTYPAEEYVPPDVSAHVITSSTNRGPAYGRNVLLRASTSEYIHFHDADDLLHLHWCEEVLTVIQRTATDVVFTEIESFTAQGILSKNVLGLSHLAEGDDLTSFCIQGSMLVPAGTYRSEIVAALDGYRESLWQAEDYDFHIRLAASGIRYQIICEPLVQIRLRVEGRSANKHEVWSSAMQVIVLQAKELPAHYRLDLAKAAARIGSHLFKLNDHHNARVAFRLAQRLGLVSFESQRGFYRFVAKRFGLEAAEWAGMYYRKIVPEAVRCRLVARGW